MYRYTGYRYEYLCLQILKIVVCIIKRDKIINKEPYPHSKILYYKQTMSLFLSTGRQGRRIKQKSTLSNKTRFFTFVNFGFGLNVVLVCSLLLVLLLFASNVQANAIDYKYDTINTDSNNDDVYDVPSFTIHELVSFFQKQQQHHQLHTISDKLNILNEKEKTLYNSLTTTGLISIKLVTDDENDDNNDYSLARNVALSGLCKCAPPINTSTDTNSKKDYDAAKETLFRTVTGAKQKIQSTNTEGEEEIQVMARSTIATATVPNNIPLSLSNVDQLILTCGNDVTQSMELLRDIVSYASNAFIQSIDNLLLLTTTTESDTKSSSSSASTSVHHNHQYHQQHSFSSSSSSHPPLLQTITGTSFHTMNSIINSSTHLEHFHVYRKHTYRDSTNHNSVSSSLNISKSKRLSTTTKKATSSTKTSHLNNNNNSKEKNSNNNLLLDVHTDAGLFLSFVPGFNCHDKNNDDMSSSSSSWDNSGLYIKVVDSEAPLTTKTSSSKQQQQFKLKRVNFQKNTIGILLGIGMQNWLQLSSNNIHNNSSNKKINFRATQHAIYMPNNGRSARSWYGKSKNMCCSFIFDLIYCFCIMSIFY
jgi:hypothetical protein